MRRARAEEARRGGFTLLEILISIALTLVVIAAVFALLGRGQRSHERELQVAAMQESARAGMVWIDRDLLMAGLRTPPASAILWNDGGGLQPDEITILYADPDIPTAKPFIGPAGGGTITNSATLFLETESLDPYPADLEHAYRKGMVLMAIETDDCNGDGQIGITPFQLTTDPVCTNAGGNRPGGTTCETLKLNHNPSGVAELNPPGGFNGQVREDCAIVGFFRAIQYRVNPPPPTDNPVLERRDLSVGPSWTAVANNIENLQFTYQLGFDPNLVDQPSRAPDPQDASTWITAVSVSLAGRSERTNLEGASPGVFATEDTHLRRGFTSRTSLRNVVTAAELKHLEPVP